MVYDFGQISGETEQKYIKEIVNHNVRYCVTACNELVATIILINAGIIMILVQALEQFQYFIS